MGSNQSNTCKVIGYTSTWVEFEDNCFAQGASRYAYRGTFHGDNHLEGKPCVVKVYKEEWYEHLSEYAWKADGRAYRKADEMAQLFNMKYNTSTPIQFVKPEFTRLDTRVTFKFLGFIPFARKVKGNIPGTFDSVSNIIPAHATLAVERYLEGDYVIFSNNTGYVNNDDIVSPTAFSHFTYHASYGKVLVCNLRGVRTSRGYMFTDPAVHSGGTELAVYGPTDLGKFGILRFFENHRCNELCEGLRKPKITKVLPGERVNLAKIADSMPFHNASTYTHQLSVSSGVSTLEVTQIQNNLRLEAVDEEPVLRSEQAISPLPANRPEATNDMPYCNVAPDLSFSRDLLVTENELGRGQFGRVLLGKALGIQETGRETKVAVKTLKEGADRQARMELLSELELMKTVGSHPNVVKLLGYCAEKDPVYVIVEYLAKGDLKNVLMEYRDKDPGASNSNLPGLSKSLSRTLVKFARDVANGMAFVSSQKCVHRDLAARNVLVGDDMVCKVSDFGLARDVMNIRIYQRKSEGMLPILWMALESILYDVYTTESDVWSFGILLWEIVTLGARPYPTMMNINAVVSQLQQGYRMPKPQHCKKQLYDMMCSCWQKTPRERPTFQSLYQQLDDMLSGDEDYITIHKLDESIYEVTMIEDTNKKL